MTTERETLLAYVHATSLPRVNGVAPFTNDIVGRISRDILPMSSIKVFPWVVMVDRGDDVKGAASSQRRFLTLRLTLAVYFKADPDEAADTRVNSLWGDLVFAMTGPDYTTHNTNAIYTRFTGMDVFPAEHDRIQAMLVDFELDYSNTWTAP